MCKYLFIVVIFLENDVDSAYLTVLVVFVGYLYVFISICAYNAFFS